MPDQEQRRYLFVAIDRATHWVYVEILEDKSATAASDFLARLIDKAPFTISKVLMEKARNLLIASVPPASASRPVPCLRSGLYRQPHRAPAHQTNVAIGPANATR